MRQLYQPQNGNILRCPLAHFYSAIDSVIDQRRQKIDPTGKHRDDPNEAAKRSQKQPGQDLREPRKGNDDAE